METSQLYSVKVLSVICAYHFTSDCFSNLSQYDTGLAMSKKMDQYQLSVAKQMSEM